MQDDQSNGESLQFLAIHLSSIRSPCPLLPIPDIGQASAASAMGNLNSTQETALSKSSQSSSATSNNVEARLRRASGQRSLGILCSPPMFNFRSKCAEERQIYRVS
ncbi:hypothetical protein HN011_006982 [Eciton burchellii]|nr:hypothetical protein HN011_006982 [Eciton burchellii]